MSLTETNKYQGWILDTIDSLRLRKARPDLERICRMIRRQHGSDPDQTRAELDKLIQSQTVLKVNYKGSFSYRNAAKVLRKGRKSSELSGDDGAENLNNSASDPDHASAHRRQPEPCDGAAPRCAPQENQETGDRTDTGSCPQQEGGREPSRVGHTPWTHSSTPRAEDLSPDASCPTVKTYNVPSQRHTPSSKPKLRTARSAPGPVASVRSLWSSPADRTKTSGLNVSDVSGLSCEEKPAQGNDKVMVEREEARPHWTTNIPVCAAPESTGGKNDITQSAGEDRKQDPQEEQMEEDFSQIWAESSRSPVTMTTDPDAEDAEVQTTSHQSKGTPTASPTDSGLDEPGSFMEPLSPIHWSVADVVSYFSAAGFPEQAAAFRKQEIDGKSLLLMQRSDVLTGLAIKLGPALKIYEHHVKALQKMHFEEEEL